MNVLIAFLILFGAVRRPAAAQPTHDAGSPGRQATPATGVLQPGDRIVAVDGDARRRRDQRRASRSPATAAPARWPTAASAARPRRVTRPARRPRRVTRPRHGRATTRRPSGRCSASRSASTSDPSGPVAGGVGTRRERCGASRRRPSTAIGRIFYARGAQADLRASWAPTRPRGRPSTSTRDALADPRADLAVAGHRQPVPVPAAGRRPHLLGAGREGPRPADPVPRDGARQHRRVRAGRLPVRRSG